MFTFRVSFFFLQRLSRGARSTNLEVEGLWLCVLHQEIGKNRLWH